MSHPVRAVVCRATLLAPLAAALLAGAALPRAAAAGPPWIGVELPANPHDPATRGALVVVRLYHHSTPSPFALDAQAVGTVDGARRTVRLDAQPAGAPGVYAVRGTLPAGDGWVLVLTMQAGPSARASALVALDRRGEVAGVRVPSEPIEGGRWTNPREGHPAEIDGMLRRAVAAGGPAPAARVSVRQVGPGGAGVALAGLGLAALVPLGARRRQGNR